MILMTSAALCLALNIYHEARGEPVIGQMVVGKVVMNRANWEQNNVCKVVFKPAQFSWVKRGYVKKAGDSYAIVQNVLPKDVKAWNQALAVTHFVMAGFAAGLKDLVKFRNATHFHRYDTIADWSTKGKFLGRIGDHLFFDLSA